MSRRLMVSRFPFTFAVALSVRRTFRMSPKRARARRATLIFTVAVLARRSLRVARPIVT
jgi:hypothetical protein